MQRIIRYYRDLHRIAELDMELPQTYAYLQEALKRLPCRLLHPLPYAIGAYFDNKKADTVALRSDMDALRIQEETKLPFASVHDGCMHACGHDGHMAMLLETAQRLAAYYQTLPFNVLLLFQPGEENCGGARLLCQSGILTDCHVRCIFALHLMPQLPAGRLAGKEGVLMAGSKEITIQIQGESAHVAVYQKGKDALACAVHLITQLYERSRPHDFLFRINKMRSGTVCNAVAAEAKLYGTLRYLKKEELEQFQKMMQIAIKEAERIYQTNISVVSSRGYPPVENDILLFRYIQQLQKKMYLLSAPQYTSEDFSFYLQQVPGVFCFLGIGDTPPLHSSRFCFPEEVLQQGAAYYDMLLRKDPLSYRKEHISSAFR